MASNSNLDKMGRLVRAPHSKKTIVITASILMAAVPGAAIAMSINSSSHISKPASISIRPTNIVNPPEVPDTAAPPVSALEAENSKGSTQGTTVTVNGESIAVPKSGSMNKTVPTDGGTATIQTSTSGASNKTTTSSHTSTRVYSSTNGKTGDNNVNISISQSN